MCTVLDSDMLTVIEEPKKVEEVKVEPKKEFVKEIFNIYVASGIFKKNEEDEKN